jgi:hypothetical protein
VNGPRIGMTIGSLDHPELVTPIVQVGNESRLPYFAALARLPGESTTEEDDPDGAPAIKASNRQHPDHDTDTWPPEGRAP